MDIRCCFDGVFLCIPCRCKLFRMLSVIIQLLLLDATEITRYNRWISVYFHNWFAVNLFGRRLVFDPSHPNLWSEQHTILWILKIFPAFRSCPVKVLSSSPENPGDCVPSLGLSMYPGVDAAIDPPRLIPLLALSPLNLGPSAAEVFAGATISSCGSNSGGTGLDKAFC